MGSLAVLSIIALSVAARLGRVADRSGDGGAQSGTQSDHQSVSAKSVADRSEKPGGEAPYPPHDRIREVVRGAGGGGGPDRAERIIEGLRALIDQGVVSADDISGFLSMGKLSDDLVLAWEIAGELLPGAEAQAARQNLLQSTTSQSLETAARLVRDLPPGHDASELQGAFVEAGFRVDPRAVLRWISELAFKESRQNAERSFASMLGSESTTEETLQSLLTMPEAKGFRGDIQSEMFRIRYKADPVQAVEWIRNHEDFGSGWSFTKGVLWQLGNKQPEAALQLAETLPSPTESRLSGEMVRLLSSLTAASDPGRTLDLIMTVPAGLERNDLIDNFATRVAAHRPEALVGSLEQLSESERDRAAKDAASILIRKGLADSSQVRSVIRMIADEKERQRLLGEYEREWGKPGQP